MIALTLYTVGKIFKADLNGDMFGSIGIIELFVLDWMLLIKLI